MIKIKTVTGFHLLGSDGEVGKVKEFYFDDHHWTIRYLVADTGSWLIGRQVLIAPNALKSVNVSDKQILINLTKKQIEESPSLDSDKPVSRQFEHSYFTYYGWPTYWSSSTAPPVNAQPWTPKEEAPEPPFLSESWDPQLRSTRSVTGYEICATDGEVGHVEDFIIDEDTWTIRYLVVDTMNWWPGKKVLISPQWIDRVSWAESKVFVNLDKDTIKESPDYSDEMNLDRDYEASLYSHYKRNGYWMQEPKHVAPLR